MNILKGWLKMLNQNPSVRRLRMGPLFMVVFLAALVLVSTALFGQTTVSTVCDRPGRHAARDLSRNGYTPGE